MLREPGEIDCGLRITKFRITSIHKQKSRLFQPAPFLYPQNVSVVVLQRNYIIVDFPMVLLSRTGVGISFLRI